MVRYLLPILLCIITALPAQAAMRWEMDAGKSMLSFGVEQNGTLTKGQFSAFTADIAFHPKDLATSKIRVEVDMRHVEAAYEEVPKTLRTAEWFNSIEFPTAVFESRRFTQVTDTHFQVAGDVTIKGISKPVTLDIYLDAFDAEHAIVLGETYMERKDFAIGWDDTETVSNKVQVTFTITATPAE